MPSRSSQIALVRALSEARSLRVDGYAAYTSLAGGTKSSGKIRLAYFLVHDAIYAIEETIRGLSADLRRSVRQSLSASAKPLMESLARGVDRSSWRR
ncbi:hypothetical protein [Mesorhizobium sp.]|uniref:hypothetical protein n=1 Tax=Mesorhizobium sp. TaxID=1871066 RepID=UPI002687B956